MSHVLALWPGARPQDAESACADYSRRVITRGIQWYRDGIAPSQDPRVLDVVRDAFALLPSDPDDPRCPWSHPEFGAQVWGEVLTLDLRGTQPAALAMLTGLADHHDLVLFDLLVHRVLTIDDISSTFGQPLVPVPSRITPFDRWTRCTAMETVCEELGVFAPNDGDCSWDIDPLDVAPIADEVATFDEVLRLFGLDHLAELSERIERVMHAVDR